eukprot:Hpha_TRINITY_DN23491_c0_g1::TRINITY_DN23491_c0_g1_i1::g.113974::m.113974
MSRVGDLERYVRWLLFVRLDSERDPSWVARQLLKLPGGRSSTVLVSHALSDAQSFPARSLPLAAQVARGLQEGGWSEPVTRAADAIVESMRAAVEEEESTRIRNAARGEEEKAFGWGAPRVDGTPWTAQDRAAAEERALRQGGRQPACCAAALLGHLAAAGVVSYGAVAGVVVCLASPPTNADLKAVYLRLRLCCMLADGAGGLCSALLEGSLRLVAALARSRAPLPTDLAGHVAAALGHLPGDAAAAASALAASGEAGLRLLRLHRNLSGGSKATGRGWLPVTEEWGRPLGPEAEGVRTGRGVDQDTHREAPRPGGRGESFHAEFDALFAAAVAAPGRPQGQLHAP